jgi:putative methionine-R-sulfoxide reductase with GAF domain
MEDRDALQILTDRRGTMYDPRVVDTFFAMHGSGIDMAPMPPPVNPRHSALQAPLAAGDDHHELDLRTFFEFGRALGAPASMSELGEIVWTQFKTRLPASTFVLYGYDHADDSIVAVYEAAVDRYPVRTTRIPLGERVSGWVAATRQAAVNSDARLDLDETSRDQSALRSALAVPVIANGRSAGVLSFYACEPNAFDDTHRRLIAAASQVLAPSMTEIADRGVRRVPDAPQNSTHVLRN